MKISCFVICLFSVIITRSQSYTVEINSGNHDDIISSYYDRNNNQLIALDKLGFIVCWDLDNYSIINKFQLPPESPYTTAKKEMFGKYEVKASDSIITVTYPKSAYNNNNGERLVDIYNRRTGAFIMQSYPGQITNVAFTKDKAMLSAIVTTNKSGYVELFQEGRLVKTDANNKSIQVSLDAAVSCMELNENKKCMVLGYENGRIEIRDIETLQLLKSFNYYTAETEKSIGQVVFIPCTDNIAINAERSGKFFIADIRTGAMADSMELEVSNYRMAVSPSGKYLSVLRSGFYYLYVRDLQKKVTEKKLLHSKTNTLSLFLNEAYFISENILVAIGKNAWPSQTIKVNGIGNAGAYLGLIELSTSIASANLNLVTASSWMEEYGTKLLKTAPLETVIYGFSDEVAYSDPATLTVKTGILKNIKGNDFNAYLTNNKLTSLYAEPLSRVGNISAPDLSDAKVAAILYNITSISRKFSGSVSDTFFIAYYNIPKDSFITHSPLYIPGKDAPYYNLIGVLQKTGLSFFSHRYNDPQNNGRQTRNLVIFNEQGRKVFQDSLAGTYSGNNMLSISADQKYFSYQPDPATLITRSLKDFSVVQTLQTGFSKYYYDVTGFAHPRFLPGKPSTLLHEAYKVVNNNPQFCLLSTDVISKKTDTVILFSLRPISYEADSTGKVINLVYNYDFSDTSVINLRTIKRISEQSFKPAYKPTILLYDTDKKDFIQTIHTGRTGISYAVQNAEWLTVLQNDGKLLYINIKTNSKLSHIIDGNAQALLADSFYYSSQKLLPLIKFKTAKRSFSAIQADIFLNRPHAILQQLSSFDRDAIKAYQLAYNKRLGQHQFTVSDFRNWLKEDDDIKTLGAIQSFIQTDKKEVVLPFNTSSNKSAINKVRIYLNGQPVSGRKGLDIKKVLSDKKLSFELSTGENYISLIAETVNGKQLDPVKYFYIYDPAVFPKRQLYFLAAGVSEYKDSTYNLKYAAKDAQDISYALAGKDQSAGKTHVILNKEVTVQNIKGWSEEIKKAGVDDVVILYLAGHGLLDARNNFYYAVHDMDFKSPEKKGLAYETILDILEQSPSRNKILIMDACHSGSFDRSLAKQVIKTSPGEGGKVVSNEKRGATADENGSDISEQQAFILMNQVFADLSADIGIDVIAASLGNSYALEKSDLQNGLFTYAMIRATALGMAAEPGSDVFTLEQVKQYVEKEVKRLSNGAQVPSMPSSNIRSETMQIFQGNRFRSDPLFEDFLKKYK